MAAGINDKISKVSSGVRPVSTTVSTIRNSGATTLACADLTGWTTTEVVFFVTYKIDGAGDVVPGSQSDWKGIVSGSNINNLTLTGGSDAGNAAGDVVEMLPTAEYAKQLATNILSHANQDGSLIPTVVSTAITASPLTTAQIVDGSITTAKLSTSSGQIAGAWTAYTPTITGITVGNGTVTAQYLEVGKTIQAIIRLVWGATTSQSGTFTFTLPVAAHSLYVAGQSGIGEMSSYDASATQLYKSTVFLSSSTVGVPKVFRSDGVFLYSANTDNVTATQPITFATNDTHTITLTYQAA